jgi:hypothetical protein
VLSSHVAGHPEPSGAESPAFGTWMIRPATRDDATALHEVAAALHEVATALHEVAAATFALACPAHTTVEDSRPS